MGHRDHPRPLPDGAMCTACGAPVPTGRIRILARRDDLVGDPATGAGIARGGTVRAISAADVEAIRDDLAAWDGDLVGWLDALEDSGRSASVVDR